MQRDLPESAGHWLGVGTWQEEAKALYTSGETSSISTVDDLEGAERETRHHQHRPTIYGFSMNILIKTCIARGILARY